MEIVRAGLRYEGNLPAATRAELGRVVGAVDPELLHRFQRLLKAEQ